MQSNVMKIIKKSNRILMVGISVMILAFGFVSIGCVSTIKLHKMDLYPNPNVQSQLPNLQNATVVDKKSYQKAEKIERLFDNSGEVLGYYTIDLSYTSPFTLGRILWWPLHEMTLLSTMFLGVPTDTRTFYLTANLNIYDSSGNWVQSFGKTKRIFKTAGLYYGHNPTPKAEREYSKLFEEVFADANRQSRDIERLLTAAGPVSSQNAEAARAKIRRFEFPERHAIDKNYWRAQAQQRVLPDQNTFAYYLRDSRDSDGNQVILDIVPGTKIYNVQDIYAEYAVSFRSVDMPEDIRQQLQRYRTAEGMTYYEYVVSHVDRIILPPKLAWAMGTTFYSNNVYPAERVIMIDKYYCDVRYAFGFERFLHVLIHETGHHHLFDLTKARIVTRKNTFTFEPSGSKVTAEDERFARLQELAFLENLWERPMNLDNYKNKDYRSSGPIGTCLASIVRYNKTLGLPEDNHELLPQSVYAPVAASPAKP
ncbi:hypothetical protein FACS1894190_04290 [Spirochaetia bacterium]|nr:hypothetical protein FACS1894190_04290 [Spirochaetia bacterium]